MPLTLVPDTLARRGLGFTFVGANAGPECAGCPFQKLCFGLQPGHRYEVTALREVTHPCALHEGGRVRVAEVVDAPFASTVETRLLRGTAATWTPIPCGMPECPTWALCHPVGPLPGVRDQIVAEEGPVPCPAGFELTRVQLKPME
ncbi:MAG: uncharacterized protein QOI63_777 [Thermoplasmata archaeon]|jgi:uncharacterized protein (UPF0179 family)|nr:uncharacterized protein [Thermoplasmata archaeon]